MEQTYLIDKDKELAEILLGKSDEMKCFNKKSIEEKIVFIEDVLTRLKPHVDADNYAFIERIDEDDIPIVLGGYFNRWIDVLKIYVPIPTKEFRNNIND